PTAPSSLTATVISATQINLFWSDNSDNETGFKIERKVGSGGTYTQIAEVGAGVTSYPNTALSPTTTYYYQVRAYNTGGNSSYSNEAGTLTSWGSMTTTGAPLSRTTHTAIWADNIGMVCWGGWDGQNTLNTGGIYSPTANTWTGITTTGAPASRTSHSDIWTGSKMIVWGGYTVAASDTQTIDNCETAWTTTAISVTSTSSTDRQEGSFSAQLDIDSPFATGLIAYRDLASSLNISARTKVSFWLKASDNLQGGVLSFLMAVVTGCATTVEDLSINTTLNAGAWTFITLTLCNPALLTELKSVGLKAATDPGPVTILIDKIEASEGGTTYYNTGAIYDPSSNAWTSMSLTNAPEPRAYHSAIWTGSTMLIWGGKSTSSYKNGGVYDPLTNEWKTGWQLDNLRNGSHIKTPSVRSKHLSFWTGEGTEEWRNKMLVWGGDGGGTTGGLYDISADIWKPISTTNAPSQRWGFSNVWTGPGSEPWRTKLIIWGGYNGTAPLSDGAIYDPDADLWTPLSITSSLSARMYHTAVWTGNKMFIWGGDGVSTAGAIYNPLYNTTEPTTIIDAPTARLYQTGVWSDPAKGGTDEVIIWGGSNGITFFNSGGRYKME
ncbi:MAG: fibronectin type III domain-containing protein, partial [Planctomycetota bacterium]|nr:fibronectin type III domain-containing protein [Planctomycetota bacterium]